MYHVPFTDRAQFEAAWPHFLSVASDGSPVTLSRGHDRWTAVDFDAGVVICTPNTGQLIEGMDADVICVSGDPSTDVSVLADTSNVTHVFKGGIKYKG